MESVAGQLNPQYLRRLSIQDLREEYRYPWPKRFRSGLYCSVPLPPYLRTGQKKTPSYAPGWQELRMRNALLLFSSPEATISFLEPIFLPRSTHGWNWTTVPIRFLSKFKNKLVYYKTASRWGVVKGLCQKFLNFLDREPYREIPHFFIPDESDEEKRQEPVERGKSVGIVSRLPPPWSSPSTALGTSGKNINWEDGAISIPYEDIS